MIDLSWSHILLVLIVALVVVGPKDLPKLMHTVGRWMGKARQMADQFRKSFDDMTREAELHELRAEIDALRTSKPLAGLEGDLHKSILPPEFSAKPTVVVENAPSEPAVSTVRRENSELPTHE